RVVSGLGVQSRAMNQQRSALRIAGGPGVHARAGHLQPHLDAEGRFGFPLVFEDHFGSGYRRQAMQVFELFLHLAVPGSLRVETKITKNGFHIYSVDGFVVVAAAERRRWRPRRRRRSRSFVEREKPQTCSLGTLSFVNASWAWVWPVSSPIR